MFDFQLWIEIFQDHWRQNGAPYNDAADMISLDDPSYSVTIQNIENPIVRVLGVHHLTGAENKAPSEEFGKHNVYLRVLCKQNEMNGFRAMNWSWIGRQLDQPAPPVFGAMKSADELVDLPLNLGMIVSVWTQGSAIVKGISSNHPDDQEGNTIGHHSFFVCFQEIDPDEPDEPYEPEPPDPKPTSKKVVISIDKDWLDNQEIDEGIIKIYGEADNE